MKKILIFLIFILSIPRLGFGACAKVPVETNFAQSDFVFIGEVISIQGNTRDKVKIMIKLIKQFKGLAAKQVSIVQPGCLYAPEEYSDYTKDQRDSSKNFRCGIEDALKFQKGKQYLVYAEVTEGQLTTSICSETKELSEVPRADLAELEKISQTKKN